ncbi:MAG: type I glutamate--ammonia ligase [Bacilli bacterium]|nr:type I glutamate--ammonia ligase [Bacilli bacterium]
MDRREIDRLIQENNILYIRLQFTDMLGDIKAVEIPVGKLDDALNNKIMFDGSSIEGFVRIKEADMYLYPDINTFLVLPFEDGNFGGVARFICDVYTPNGKPFAGDPRYILKRQIKKMNDMGIEKLCVGFEPEFYLFKMNDNPLSTITSDNASYFDLSPFAIGGDIRREIALTLERMGFEVQASHHEVGPGQNEITFKYDDVISACDKVQTFKQVVKVIARKRGYLASFMPKPLNARPGNGMHTNCSLFDSKKGDLFYDKNADMELSLLCKKWITGILNHAKELALLTNPIVNSYKRLVSGYEAPIYACWSDANRSSLIRIPAIRGNATRTELRNVDPCANPYLALAGILAAGLEGINTVEEKDIIAPVSDNLFAMSEDEIEEKGIEHLPETLHSAVKFFKKSQLMHDVLGDHLYYKYIDAKEKEWKCYHTTVSEFELRKYLSR